LLLVLASSACDKKPAAIADGADAQDASATQAPEEPARELTPADRAAYAQVKVKLWTSQRKAFDRAARLAISSANQKSRNSNESAGERPASLDGAEHFTILFSANNHGEREDCGCKHNPLGGLDRRATMVSLAREQDPGKPLVKKYWGPKQAAPEATFLVDAGDMFYKSSSLRDGAPAMRDKAEGYADAVVEAMNQFPPDVFNVGELDLAMGIARLQELEKKAKFPFISANLLDAKTKKPIFSGTKIIDRDGHKIAFIGLLKSRPKIKEYYEARGLEVRDSLEAYREQVEALPADVDLVVLLSNDGVGRVQTFLGDLESQKLRVDLVLVSNSNRLTREPTWASGTPILEPMSRGKYFGRVDVWKASDGAAKYSNDSPGDLTVAQDYKRLWGRYLQSRIGYYQAQERLATIEIEEAASKAAPAANTPTDGKKAPKVKITDPKRRTMIEKQEELYGQRLDLTAAEVGVLVQQFSSPGEEDESAGGKDWIEASVMPVAIDIPQDKAVRKVLDKHAKDK
jgi:hypothetical protein